MQINICKAKGRLSALISAAERDEEVIIARHGEPVAKIVRYSASKVAPPGVWKGTVAYVNDWNSSETNDVVTQLFTGTDDAFTS